MNCLNFATFIRAECNQCFSRCREKTRKCSIELYALFQRVMSIFSPASRHSSPSTSSPLLTRSVKIGGIENAGNTCTLSVLIQELAAEFDFYYPFFITSLEMGIEESEKDFALRKQLQVHLYRCVKDVCAGATVSRDNVIHLASLLQKLGWNKDPAPLWHRLLHKLAPALFPTLYSPHKLYDKIISLFSEAYDPEYQIILLNKDADSTITQLFERSLFNAQSKSAPQTLWKVCVEQKSTTSLQEKFQVQQQLFSLKLVHACYDTPYGKHVVVYRKTEGCWISCNDAQITRVETLPPHDIYALIYESQSV